MSDTYQPPKVWEWKQDNNQAFGNINRPTAGARQEKELPIGKHPLQLYSLGTPNGVKVTIMLEELLARGHSGAEYDAWLVNIGDGSQFGSGYEINAVGGACGGTLSGSTYTTAAVTQDCTVAAEFSELPINGGLPVWLMNEASKAVAPN